MAASRKKKGDTLEQAVRAIELAILQQSPGYNEKTVRIEGNKRFKSSAGVPHEVDIWVTVELATGYDATFIFECKNWKRKVVKKEAADFARKVEDAKAQRGFLVAAMLTKGAEANLVDTQGVFFQYDEDGVVTDMRFDVVEKHHGDVVDVPGAEWNAGSKANHKFTPQECSAAMAFLL
jgi:hypothetical protein